MKALLTIAASILVGAEVFAAPPTLEALVPSGAKIGENEVTVTASGKVEPWPVEVWSSNPAVRFRPQEEKGRFLVEVAPDANPGPCWVRLFNAEGASEPRIFVLGDLREVTEDASVSNDGPGEAAEIGSLPVVINGRLEKSQDVDAWKFPLEAGQVLRARLDGYSLRSGIDPFLHLYDPSGVRVALGNDNPRNLDPRLEYRAEKTGDYVVAVMAIASPPNANVTFHGAGGAAWRLLLTTEEGDLPVEVAAAVPEADTLGVDDGPKKPRELPIDGFGSLRESDPRGRDEIAFSATKGQSLQLEVVAADLAFPTDPVLELVKEDGSPIREVDDTKSDRDAEYLFKVPADGTYLARVSDRFGRKGESMRYQLKISNSAPSFTAVCDQANYRVEPGKETAIKVTVNRLGGHDKAVRAEVIGLPEGVDAEPVLIDPKSKEGTLTLRASMEADHYSGPMKVRVSEAEADPAVNRYAVFSFQDSNARGPYLLDEIEDLWLTVVKSAGKGDKKS